MEIIQIKKFYSKFKLSHQNLRQNHTNFTNFIKKICEMQMRFSS